MKKLSSLHPAIHETAIYGSGTLLSQVLSAFRGLIVASMLGPATYGLWKSVQVVLDWLAYTHFGVLHGMARQIPISRKRGDREEESASRAVGLRIALLTAVLSGILLVVVTFGRGNVPWKVWVGIAAILLVSQLFRYIHMVCLADGRFGILSGANLLLALSSLVLMVALVPHYGIYGVLTGLGLGYLAAVVMGVIKSVFGYGKFKTPLLTVTKKLAFAGFPFMAVDGLFVFWQRLDRIVLIPFYGAESVALGYYGLATMVASFAIQIPQIFTRVLFRRTVPVFETDLIETNETKSEKMKHLEAPCLIVSSVSPLLLSLGVVCSWAMITWFLPDYSSIRHSGKGGCEESIALLLLASYGCSVGLSFRNIYTGMNHQWRLAGIYGICCLATVLPPLLLLGRATMIDPVGIRTAAWGMVIGSTLYAFLALVDCSRLCGSSVKDILALLTRASWPLLVYAGWTYWALQTLSSGRSPTIPLSYWGILLTSAVLLHSPIAVYGTWKVWRRFQGEGLRA